MNTLVIAVGALVFGVGVAFLAKPTLMDSWVDTVSHPVWVYVGLTLRMVLGAFFIAASPQAAWPSFIYWFGWLMIAAGLIGILIGHAKLLIFIEKMRLLSTLQVRVFGLFAVVVGAVIAVAA